MSFKISPKFNHKISSASSDNGGSIKDEWVEIIEPKSKTKIYANLQSGICAKNPPDGVPVLTTDDFSDHWWELYDKKTGKYYYYNPEQQKTVWTKPTANGNGNNRRLLIIPVSKLRTFRKMTSDDNQSEKRDATTQTIASSLTSTGTQTISETDLEVELNDKLRIVNISSNSPKSNSCTHTGSSNTTNDKQPPKPQMSHRQYSDFTGRPRNPYLKNYQKQITIADERPYRNANDQIDHRISSHYKTSADSNYQARKEFDSDTKMNSYFTPPLSTYQKNRNSLHIQEPVSSFVGGSRRDELKSSTSTFKKTAPSESTTRPVQLVSRPNQGPNTSGFSSAETRQTNTDNNPQHMVTNNLSHYLVREARAIGIALISDDEVEDDDQDSDEECNLDDDEDTDLRDDLSNHQEVSSELNASQELGGEDSSEGWKSFSDQDSPNEPQNHMTKHRTGSSSRSQKSPMLDETASTSFNYNELIDDQRDPSACMSQQLDHRKLVANFKKSRHTSALGFNDSLGRSYKLDANQAVQRIKTVADSYFNNNNDRDRPSEKNLRQISALTTLPRPSKDKLATNDHGNLDVEVDADYDVVEENCSFYSDSERLHAEQLSLSGLDVTKSTTSPSSTNKAKQSSSPTSYFDRNKSTRGSTFSVESFARENLTRHPKGGLLFNKKVKWSRMISWTKNSIKQPMISSVSSDLNSDSISCFKLIQQFMGDRKVNINKKYRQILTQAGVSEESYGSRKSLGRSNSLNVKGNGNASGSGASSTQSQVPDRLRDEIAYELSVKGCTKPALRDEIFVQLARQLTDNPCQDSITWGLILMSILLSYFSPSSKFSPFLLAFLESHSHAMARDVCLPRLEKRLKNLISYCRKPADGQEISIVRLSITKWPQYCGVFGESLEKIMSSQACSPYLKTLRLPWILTTLGEKLVVTGGYRTEGLFRCAADHDLLAQLRLEIDCVDFRKITDAKHVKSLLSNVQDPHVIAGLLKLFFRQLQEPVFPSRMYDACLSSCQDGQIACRLFDERLPNLNKDVVAYLIRLLQTLAESDHVLHTKMDSSNLSMVWAPNLLRAPEVEQPPPTTGGDSKTSSKWSIANVDDNQQATMNTSSASTAATSQSQSMIFEHARREMQFIKALISHLDTSFIANVV